MTKTLTGLAIALGLLAFTLPATAQEPDEKGQFYIDFAGSGVFPYDPKTPSDLGFKAGAGFTAAFDYAFKEGCSIEIEGGYQKVSITDPFGAFNEAQLLIPQVQITGPTGPGIDAPTGGAGWASESSSGVLTGGYFPLPTVEIDGEMQDAVPSTKTRMSLSPCLTFGEDLPVRTGF